MRKLRLFLTITIIGSAFLAHGLKKPGSVSRAEWKLMTTAEKRTAIESAKRTPDVWHRAYPEIEKPKRPEKPIMPKPWPTAKPKVPYYEGRPFAGMKYVESKEPLRKKRPGKLERLEAQQKARQKIEARRKESAELLRRLRKDWKDIKNIWYVSLTEREKMFLWPKLSSDQKSELRETKRKEIINKIEAKLYSKNKNISEKEWLEAREASRLTPGFKSDIATLLKKQRIEVLIAARIIDKIERKLKSERKRILETEWDLAQKSANTIKYYKPDIRKILSRRLADVIRTAKKIDSIEKRLMKEYISFGEAKKLLPELNNLPEYKRDIKKILLRFYPRLETFDRIEMMKRQRAEQLKIQEMLRKKDEAAKIKKKLRRRRKKKPRASSA